MKPRKPPVSHPPTFVAQIITECLGHTGNAAIKLKMTPASVRSYIHKYPVCKDAYEDALTDIVGHAEQNLYEFVLDGDRTATLFVLKTLARAKYSEQQQPQYDSPEPINFEIDRPEPNE